METINVCIILLVHLYVCVLGLNHDSIEKNGSAALKLVVTTETSG